MVDSEEFSESTEHFAAIRCSNRGTWMRLTLVYDGESKGSSHIVDADTGERLEKVESFTMVRGEGSGRDKLTLTVALPTGLEGDRALIASGISEAEQTRQERPLEISL